MNPASGIQETEGKKYDYGRERTMLRVGEGRWKVGRGRRLKAEGK